MALRLSFQVTHYGNAYLIIHTLYEFHPIIKHNFSHYPNIPLNYYLTKDRKSPTKNAYHKTFR